MATDELLKRRVTGELDQTRADLASSVAERDSLHRTLGRVHEQLTALKSDSSGKALELAELQLYYDGLLEAKEASIQSLQTLLEGQQKQLREQQELWDEQRRSLKASINDLSERVAASHAAAADAAAMQQAAALAKELRERLLAAERALEDAGAREQQYVVLLKQRERHLSKLQQSQSLHRHGRQQQAAGGAGGGGGRDAVASWLGSEGSSDTASVSGSVDLAMPKGLLGGGGGGRGHHHGAVGATSPRLRDEAVAEERRKREKLKAKLVAVGREAEELRLQVSRLQAELAGARAESSSGANVQLADELLRAHRTIQDLEQRLRRAHEAARTAPGPTPPAAATAAGASGAAGAAPAPSSGPHSHTGGPGLLTSAEHLALVKQRLVRQRQEFERFMEVLVDTPGIRLSEEAAAAAAATAAGAGGGGVTLAEDLKSLMARHLTKVETIASMSALPEDVRSAADTPAAAAASQQQQQMQHSLFVARAAWSTLRKALVGLQEAVCTSLDVAANPAVAYMQNADFLSRLMREWAVGDKATLDAAIDASVSAAVALVTEAGARLQSHARDLGVSKQQLAEAQDAVAQLRLTNGLLQQEADTRLAEARGESEALRAQLESARDKVARLQVEAGAHQGELAAAQERAEAAAAAAKRAEAAVASVEGDRARLRKVLASVEGDRGSAEAVALAREEELVRLSRALSDAHATIQLLHNRLDAATAAGSTELAALKGKIRDVVTALESPSLPQLHAMMLLATEQQQQDAGEAAGAGGLGSVGRLLSGRGGGTTPRRHGSGSAGQRGVLSEDALHSLALGLTPSDGQQQQQHLDPPSVAASLVAALDSAAGSVGAALHRLALLEVAHWEAERGADAVGEVRAALAGAAMEMEAGRLAVGDVLLKELLSMLGVDARTAAASGGAGHSSAGGLSSSRPPTRGGAPPPLSASQSYSSSTWALAATGGAAGGGGGGVDAPLRLQLAAARDACQQLTRHLKNVEGIVLALKTSLPEWLDLATARAAARQRGELARLRGLLGGQLVAVRRDLAELRGSCRATLADAASQAADSLQQAQRKSAQVDRDRGEAAELLVDLQRDLSLAVELLRATTINIAPTAPTAPTAHGPAGAEAQPPPPTAGPGAASPSRGGAGGGGGGSGLLYSLAGSVAVAAKVVPELRAGLERLRGELRQLAAERDAARAGWEAAAGHACLLARAVAEALPLPEALVVALLNPATATDPAMSPVWCAQLRDAASGHVAAVAASVAGGVESGEVAPLRQEVARLSAGLKAAKRRTAELQAQAARFLAESEAALEAVRREAGQAASEVLESVMEGVREEVATVQSHVTELQESSTEALRQANAAWSAQLNQVKASSSAAVTALEDTVSVLQAQLGTEADAYDALKAEQEAAAKESLDRAAAEGNKARGLASDLSAAQQRVAALEAAEAALEAEVRQLRKALRQRDVMVLGILNESGQSAGGAATAGPAPATAVAVVPGAGAGSGAGSVGSGARSRAGTSAPQ
ncbi:hypothetical protein HYH02_002690 [Chlamydomonas schloesseri]|uniref:Uncharacterized protein n=1 Tax=Chlamydomonas schloesseri TaxID=2026947 RepID=A0A835WSD9_9CHLO|nr:hypothetical protein HYH02_002690 [Chlamydomonas schloesseri]|eukprot:KAG2452448.1 hypothetical protein HYH02_002690 [Chlamydomonas schloesseri]